MTEKPGRRFLWNMAKCPCGRECCSKKRLTSWLTTFISDAHAVMGRSTEHPPTMFLKKIRLARNAFFVNPQWLHLITSHRIFPETRHRWRYGSKKRPRKGPLISENTLNNSSSLKAARAWVSRSIDNDVTGASDKSVWNRFECLIPAARKGETHGWAE